MIKEKIKKVTELSYKYYITKDNKEQTKIDDELNNILQDLKKQAIESFESESDLKRFLDNVIFFNNYSYNNQILIWLQKPKSNYVASLKTFSKMGYRVNKDEVGIKILIPSFLKFVKIIDSENAFTIKPLYTLTQSELKKYKDKNDNSVIFYAEKVTNFRIGSVFDASQTNMPINEICNKLNPILEDDRSEGIEDIFIKAIYRDGFKVKYEDSINGGAKGYCDFENNLIVVRKNMGNLMRLKVVIHEYAHALAHNHLKDNNQDYREHRNKYESEAESIAYVVSKYLGLDAREYSTMYLYSWSKNKDFKEIDDSLNTIVNYSKRIIKNFELMYEKDQELYFSNIRV